MAERIPADMDAFLREHAARATSLPEAREAALARWPNAPGATDAQRRAHAQRIETAYKHRRKHARDAARAALAESTTSDALHHPALETVAQAAPIPAPKVVDVSPQVFELGVHDSLLGISIMDPIGSASPPRGAANASLQTTESIDPLAEWTSGTDPVQFLRRIDAATRCGADESVPRLQRMTESVEMLGVTVDNVRRAVEASPNRPVGHLSLVEVAGLAIGAIEGQRRRHPEEPSKNEGLVADLAAQVGRLADAVSQMLANAQDVGGAKDALIETQRRFIDHLQRVVGA